MITLTAIDSKFVVRELKILERAIVEKIFHPSHKEIIVQLHSSGSGKKLLKIKAGESIYITKEKNATPETPSSFCMTLRKYLQQERITGITQHEFERIIEITFSNGCKMIAELFSKGNIILVDKENKIIALLERQEWKHRTIERGKPYVYPPTTINPFTLSEEEFRKKYEESSKENLVKILATEFALGGKYAEEVCTLAKVDKKKKSIDTIKVWKAVQSLESKPLKPNVINKGVKIEISPIELVSEQEALKQYFNTFSEALEFYDKNYGEEQQEVQEEKEKLVELAELQKQHIEELKKEAEEFKKIGDVIYTHYTDIENLIREIKEKKWNVQNKIIVELKKAERKVIIEL